MKHRIQINKTIGATPVTLAVFGSYLFCKWMYETCCGYGTKYSCLTGVVCTGIGYRQFEELNAAKNVPTASTKTYSKYYDRVGDGWEETTVKEMTIAGRHEAQLHLERDDIDENGIIL
ncbi:hypothetical protein PR048_003458 [Dryococelus australis]|uniref:Mutator-like transposase domain-containing protein n=1 Tax=Dryococelus australis TaxID=614101 RepID=A0ABQ9IN29_9NEOP|nr:hypothetical protein PR048_003458 [Dryococelus australis]